MMTETRPRDRNLQVNGVRLHLREWERPHAPAIMILHGITGHAWEFDELASALAVDFHVVSVNQRGHGASAWSDTYTPATMAEDAAALIDELRLGPVSVVGHSMGGVNGWWLASDYPERVERLAILDIDPLAITDPEIGVGLDAMLGAYAKARYGSPEEGVAAYLAGYRGSAVEASREFVRRSLESREPGAWTWRCDAAGLRRWMAAAGASSEAHWRQIRGLTCPVLVVRAGDSAFTTRAGVERLAREAARARLVEIVGSGHDIHFDRLDGLVAELREFLKG